MRSRTFASGMELLSRRTHRLFGLGPLEQVPEIFGVAPRGYFELAAFAELLPCIHFYPRGERGHGTGLAKLAGRLARWTRLGPGARTS